MKVSKLHTIYSLLLAHCFNLRPEHENAIRRVWGYSDEEIYGEPIEWLDQPPPRVKCALHQRVERVTLMAPEAITGWQMSFERRSNICKCADRIPPHPVKICSMPSAIAQVVAANTLARDFNLEGVPGFYLEAGAKAPADPADNIFRRFTEQCGPWRMNLNYKDGLLVPYTNGTQWIVGLKIYRSVKDKQPTLLTSRGLPSGGKAIQSREVLAA